MQVQLNKFPKVVVKVEEQTCQQVMDKEEGEVEMLCRKGSMLGREAILWVEPTTVCQN
jgi:hypothetical protein